MLIILLLLALTPVVARGAPWIRVASLIISIVMLRSDIFSKATAVVGILANGIGLCYFITLSFAPAIYWIPHPISAPFRVIWYFLIALRLFKLAKS